MGKECKPVIDSGRPIIVAMSLRRLLFNRYNPAMADWRSPARGFLLTATIGAAVFGPLVARAPAQPTTAPTVGASVQRGLDYLAKRQNPHGAFDSGENRLAVTGLSVMAFLACGHTPEAGRYGLGVRGGID